MKLLYISEDYAASKVHHELLSRMAFKGIDITVFSVVRLVDKTNDIRITYNNINYSVATYNLKPLYERIYRYVFAFKRRLKLRKLLLLTDIRGIDIIHGATLFSEGTIAYELNKKFGIPYTVAVRGTDIDLYLSKMPHLWSLGKEILRNASKIIFISPLLQQKFFQKRPIRNIESEIRSKCIIIPNGIEDYWIENRRSITFSDTTKRNKVIFIGRFDKNKNVETLINAILKLKTKIPEIKLNLVGVGDVCHKTIMRYCTEYPYNITYLGKIYDKDKLRNVLRENDVFAMVSHSETFGLVYLEALSQGLPILYTRGQGIDGTVSDIVGEKTDSHSVEETAEKLEKLLLRVSDYKCIGDHILDFSWNGIALHYNEIFNEVIQSKE